MALKNKLREVCDAFLNAEEPDLIWQSIPSIIPDLRSEFQTKLGITPEVAEVSLILSSVEPTLACGTNIVIFQLYFPEHSGLKIRCECCLEHPNAKVSIVKTPDQEVGVAADAVTRINRNCIGNTFEANLLRLE